ncbi:MAG: aminoacyl-tRNA hydrolase [Treponema sp.]|jgi:PTH1 family peptidyl-tRNA hydrolase|nr:aminoacyl-tRNA hydrolase [Treponema sp.]
MIRLAAFLGNPGAEYERNRHNAGRLLARKFYGELPWTKKFKGLYAFKEISGGEVAVDLVPAPPFPPSLPFSRAQPDPPAPRKIHLLQPETYMNLSGESVFAAAAFYKIKPEEIIVVHDELELPPGTVSLKKGGGLGGHNGLRSMKRCFGTADFWRLRIGVGRPAGRKPGEGGRPVKGAREGGPGDIAAWVLSDFSAAEQPALDAALDAAAAVLLMAFRAGPEPLLPEWGKKNVSGVLT